MEDRNDERTGDFWDRVGEIARATWSALGHLFKEGNRRQLALRKRDGEVLVRLPLTVAALIALFLLWKAWPLLLLALIAVLALRGSVVILRRDPQQG